MIRLLHRNACTCLCTVQVAPGKFHDAKDFLKSAKINMFPGIGPGGTQPKFGQAGSAPTLTPLPCS